MDVDKFRRLEGGIIFTQRRGDFADEALVARRRWTDEVGSLHPDFEEAMQSLVVIGAVGFADLSERLATPLASTSKRQSRSSVTDPMSLAMSAFVQSSFRSTNMSVILQTMLAMFRTGENARARFRREDLSPKR